MRAYTLETGDLEQADLPRKPLGTRKVRALQLVISSSDEKLAVARSLGARDLVNCRTTPEWQDEALRITDAQGVDLVIEIG
jgi:NADPH:quinone reductase-like Zn-dependent oxidoreductase